MTKGGARNRSGPAPREDSGRSDRRGYSLQALPAEGYGGPVPDFPLPTLRIFQWEYEDKHRYQVFDAEATKTFRDRELVLWEWVWRTPQACAWAMPSEQWRAYTVGMWVRTAVVCEGSEATAADKNSLHRFADQIGMTTAGLREMGWRVAVDQVAEKATEPKQQVSSRSKLKVVRAGDGA